MREPRIEFNSCPLRTHCLKDSRVTSLGVCDGEIGNYRDCTCYKHYTEENLENPDRAFKR